MLSFSSHIPGYEKIKISARRKEMLPEKIDDARIWGGCSPLPHSARTPIFRPHMQWYSKDSLATDSEYTTTYSTTNRNKHWFQLYKSKCNKIFFLLPAQVRPSPVNPDLHAHVKDPIVLVHKALVSQLWVTLEHSLMSKNKAFRLT